MEESILNLCKSLGLFCNHLETSCDALRQSVDRRAIPLGSASSTFIQCLNRRVTNASSDLNFLESMSFGTVSFEELLGHCNEVYKSNQTHLLELQDRLKSFNFVPELEIDDGTPSGLSSPFASDSKDGLDLQSPPPVSVPCSVMKTLEEDPLLDDSLKNLGLSDVCLAALASEDNGNIDDSDVFPSEPMKYYGEKLHHTNGSPQPFVKDEGDLEDDPKSVEASRLMIKVSKDDYESLPSYMKSLASWEDLVVAVEKINSSLRRKEKRKGYNYFHPEEIESLGLGHKMKSYLLLLKHLKWFVVEVIDGQISYRVL